MISIRKGAVGIMAAGATLLGINLASAAHAHADVNDFVSDMSAAGFYNDDGPRSEVALGYHLCSELGLGMTVAQITRDMYLKTPASMTWSAAQQFVMISIKDLCPQFYGGIGVAA